VAAQERAAEAEADNTYLVRHKDALTAERDRARGEFEKLKERLDALSGAVHGTFVNLALRTLGLVERQLGVIEDLEEKESDPGRLSTLFKLDHLATRMRRYSENLLLLAGAEHVTAGHSGPVPLLDVVRAAISEIERYERVELGTLPPHVQVSGHAADDLSHLVSELLDNAATFSPPDAQVQLSGWLLESGEVMLSIDDEGIGVTSRRLAALNARLSVPEGQEPPEMDAPGAESGDRGAESGLGMGLYVVARLAARHGLRVQLRERRQGGGIAAVVAVPSALLPSRPAPVAAGSGEVSGGGGGPEALASSFPGSVAEANSNALPRRRGGVGAGFAAGTASGAVAGDGGVGAGVEDGEDPLVSAAEQAVRDAGLGAGQAGAAGGAGAPRATEEHGWARGESGTRAGHDPEPGDGATGSQPAEAEPAGAQHAETQHAETQHAGAQPTDGDSSGPDSAGTDAAGTDPAGREFTAFGTPGAGSAEAGPAQARPAEAAPADAAPTEAGSAETGSAAAGSAETVEGTGSWHGAETPGTESRRARHAAPGAVPAQEHAATRDPAHEQRTGPAREPGRVQETAPAPESGPAPEAGPGADVPEQPRVTDKGLPKRTPHHVEAQTNSAPPRRHSANAEEMRRRLGGFQRGAAHGRRDAAVETGADENVIDRRGAQSDGGTAEEART
jgi:signal transduction histidine kinase